MWSEWMKLKMNPDWSRNRCKWRMPNPAMDAKVFLERERKANGDWKNHASGKHVEGKKHVRWTGSRTVRRLVAACDAEISKALYQILILQSSLAIHWKQQRNNTREADENAMDPTMSLRRLPSLIEELLVVLQLPYDAKEHPLLLELPKLLAPYTPLVYTVGVK